MNFDIVLKIDGKDIPMNDFVKKILIGMITGAVGTLRDVNENWKSIDISIKP
ncbi:MAG: hypothetical protein J5U17_04890 [Candidatus Methanoperedens sp.]|nr:hypothetical protein [Candidatus Methanoperedens sp.]MCE8427749.1 hypothetical protein [Candidatus Methanoperedens sp.]